MCVFERESVCVFLSVFNWKYILLLLLLQRLTELINYSPELLLHVEAHIYVQVVFHVNLTDLTQ